MNCDFIGVTLNYVKGYRLKRETPTSMRNKDCYPRSARMQMIGEIVEGCEEETLSF